MSLRDELNNLLADPMSLPQEFWSYAVQHQAINGLPTAKTSGQRIAHGTNTTSVSTAGTTFGTGSDLLATALELQATGSNSYIVRVSATDWTNTTAGAGNTLRLNLDGADGGLMVNDSFASSVLQPCSGAIYITPAAGSHSVNVRLNVGSGTGTVNAGSGGVGARGPIIVTLEVA